MPKKLNTKHFLILSILLSVFFLSCQQAVADIDQANYSVIFDYENEGQLPSSRLSLFIQSKSDVRRYERVQVTSKKSGYVWTYDDLTLFLENNQQWAGNTNLVVPENTEIPDGLYEVIYFNSDGKNDKVYITVDYDKFIYSLSSDEIESYMEKENAKKKIIIFDENGYILYFGDKTEEFDSVRGIWNKFSNAQSFQNIWEGKGNTVICIMPAQKVQLESEN